MNIGIIGAGWFGAALADKLCASHQVIGTKTTQSGVEALKNKPWKTVRLNLDEKMDVDASAAVFSTDALVVNVPPPRRAENPEHVYLDRMRQIAEGIAHFQTIQKVLFISSTGVFGESQQHADEFTTPAPDRTAGRILREAELYFLERDDFRTVIIRPGGLVGGERHPVKYLAGRKDIAGRRHPVNLIHRADLITLSEKILENECAQKVFHAVASPHSSKQEYYTRAAVKLGLPAPHFDPADQSLGKYISAETTENTFEIRFRSPDEMI